MHLLLKASKQLKTHRAGESDEDLRSITFSISTCYVFTAYSRFREGGNWKSGKFALGEIYWVSFYLKSINA